MFDYAEIVKELRQGASTSRDLYLADAIEELSGFVNTVNTLRAEGWYMQRTETGAYGCSIQTMPLPEPPGQKKLFVSQPMKYLDGKAIVCARRRIIDEASRITGEQYEIIDSYIPGRKYDVKHHSVRCLADSIAFLADADAAVFGWGWEDARGCRIEHQICEDYGIPIIDLENALSTKEET